MNKFDSKETKSELLLSEIKKRKNGATCNEIINDLFEEAMAIYGKNTMRVIGWRFFVHLNKIPAFLEKEKLIHFTGEYRLGETGRMEKVWKAL